MDSHGAVASLEMSPEVVEAVMQDWQSAPITEKVRAMLGLIEKVTRSPVTVSEEDLRPLYEIGLSKQAIEDALCVSAYFHVITRIADALGVDLLTSEGYAASAMRLWQHGYE